VQSFTARMPLLLASPTSEFGLPYREDVSVLLTGVTDTASIRPVVNTENYRKVPKTTENYRKLIEN